MAAALLGAALSAGAGLYASNQVNKAAGNAAAAAGQAGKAQANGIRTGIKQSGKLYTSAQNYLSPYIDQGIEGSNLLRDIIGLNGPEAQGRALQMYQSSPSSSILDGVREEAVRRTAGEFASGGLARSGAHEEELARRMSDIDLSNYYNWEGLSKDQQQIGASAAGQASNNAMSRSGNLLGAYSDIGTAKAGGIVGGANARLAGTMGGMNYLANSAGTLAGMDFSKMFKPGNMGGFGSGNDFSAMAAPTPRSYSKFSGMFGGV